MIGAAKMQRFEFGQSAAAWLVMCFIGSAALFLGGIAATLGFVIALGLAGGAGAMFIGLRARRQAC